MTTPPLATEALTAISDALTALAVARVDATGRPAPGFVDLLHTLDTIIAEQAGAPGAPGAEYRLGLAVGYLAHVAGCRVDPGAALQPIPIDYPPTPVAEAAQALRDAVLNFPPPK